MITYVYTVNGITPKQLHGFFVNWPNPPSPETHLKLLTRSDAVVLAVDDTTKAVVGFITAITDGVLCAYIPLLEVLPSYRRQNIGSELTRRMLEHLQRYYMVDLLCDPELQPFYARFGMHPATGMMIRNDAHQAGTGS